MVNIVIKMTKEEILKIIEYGLEVCEYNYTVEDIWYKIIGIYLRETSNSRYEEEKLVE